MPRDSGRGRAPGRLRLAWARSARNDRVASILRENLRFGNWRAAPVACSRRSIRLACRRPLRARRAGKRMARRGKSAKKVKAQTRRPRAGKKPANVPAKIRELERRLVAALDQQMATGDILRVISRSQTDL